MAERRGFLLDVRVVAAVFAGRRGDAEHSGRVRSASHAPRPVDVNVAAVIRRRPRRDGKCRAALAWATARYSRPAVQEWRPPPGAAPVAPPRSSRATTRNRAWSAADSPAL